VVKKGPKEIPPPEGNLKKKQHNKYSL